MKKNTHKKTVTFYCPRGCSQVNLEENSHQECGTCGQVMSPGSAESYNTIQDLIIAEKIALWSNRGDC